MMTPTNISRQFGGLTILLILWQVLGLMVEPVKAKHLQREEVVQAVQTWVRYVTADAKPDAVIERMVPYTKDGQILAYVAYIAGGGYCLCGQDDLVVPVYLYSPEGTFHPDDPGCQFILAEIAARTQALVKATGMERSAFLEQEAQTFQQRERMWQDLIAGSVPLQTAQKSTSSSEPVKMELSLTVHWHQGHPYNDQCPFLSSPGERTLVGCQSTAFSQIMSYWRWPKTGSGSKTGSYAYRFRTSWDSHPLAVNPDPNRFPRVWRGRLDWTGYNGGTLWMTGFWDGSIYQSALNINATNEAYVNALDALYNRLSPASRQYAANFGATTYDWSLLEDTHQDPSDPGDVEVAELCFHSSVANESSFGVDATGSVWYQVDGPSGGLAQYLRYDGDSTYRSNYSDPDVPDADIMVGEIQWLRPLGMGGGPPNHAWVIFGYNKGVDPWQFKMNMGWQNDNPAWYTLDPAIPPSPNPAIPPTNHLTHIAPAGVVRFVGGGVSGDGSPQDPYANIEHAVQNAPDGTTLIFKAGSDNRFASDPLIIDKPLELKGKNAIIQKQ